MHFFNLAQKNYEYGSPLVVKNWQKIGFCCVIPSRVVITSLTVFNSFYVADLLSVLFILFTVRICKCILQHEE